VNLFLGDVVTLAKDDTYITGSVNGLKLYKGHLQLISVESVPAWFSLEKGWKVVDDEEYEVDLD
jgi:hypothetical protein